MAEAYEHVANSLGCAFVDFASVTTASAIDGVHLDLDQHAALGRALAKAVVPILRATA